MKCFTMHMRSTSCTEIQRSIQAMCFGQWLKPWVRFKRLDTEGWSQQDTSARVLTDFAERISAGSISQSCQCHLDQSISIHPLVTLSCCLLWWPHAFSVQRCAASPTLVQHYRLPNLSFNLPHLYLPLLREEDTQRLVGSKKLLYEML